MIYLIRGFLKRFGRFNVAKRVSKPKTRFCSLGIFSKNKSRLHKLFMFPKLVRPPPAYAIMADESLVRAAIFERGTNMDFQGFVEKDFAVFEIEGLEPRMDALIANVRPKLTELGNALTPFLTATCGEEMFPHVAKHARRTVHPPNDTWVAWAANKRGYKALPHFQVGMFADYLFIVMAVIYESPNKTVLANALGKHERKVLDLVPKERQEQFYWSVDHTKPGGTKHSELGKNGLKSIAERLGTVKKSEVLCGRFLQKDDPLLQDGEELVKTIEETFETLLPLYKMAF